MTGVLVLFMVSGCASSVPPTPPTARPAEGVRRIAIVATGDSKFTVVEHRSEPGRTFDEVVKWAPYPWLRPLGALVHSGISWLLDSGRAATTAADVGVVAPRVVVAEVLSRRLQASGPRRTAEWYLSTHAGENASHRSKQPLTHPR